MTAGVYCKCGTLEDREHLCAITHGVVRAERDRLLAAFDPAKDLLRCQALEAELREVLKEAPFIMEKRCESIRALLHLCGLSIQEGK